MITIIDYGVGNIFAFQNVYKRLDIPTKIAKSSQDLIDAGAPGLHFYTMNTSSATREIFEQIKDFLNKTGFVFNSLSF